MADVKFECRRCGSVFVRKDYLIAHLKRKKICAPLKDDISTDEIMEDLTKVPPNFVECPLCQKPFATQRSKKHHELYYCKLRNAQQQQINSRDTICEPIKSAKPASVLTETQTDASANRPTVLYAAGLNNANTPHTQKKVTKPNPNTIRAELMSLKTTVHELKHHVLTKSADTLPIIPKTSNSRKNESFYQAIVEKFLGASHKRLLVGITDITTDNCHAEIKDWRHWKEAVGQVMCYNAVEPKNEMHLYCFGPYKDFCKNEAIKVLQRLGIQVFEIVNEDTIPRIVNCINGSVVYLHESPSDDIASNTSASINIDIEAPDCLDCLDSLESLESLETIESLNE